MKRAINQPFFWIAVGSFVIAIVIAVISNIMNPELSVLRNLEKGCNKADIQTIISCFPPETQAEMQEQLAAFDGVADYFGMEKGEEINILSGPVITDEDGNKSVHVFMVRNIYNVFSDLESATLDLVEADGKIYLAE